MFYMTLVCRETFHPIHICKLLAEQNICNNILLSDHRNNFASSQLKKKHKRFGREMEECESIYISKYCCIVSYESSIYFKFKDKFLSVT